MMNVDVRFYWAHASFVKGIEREASRLFRYNLFLRRGGRGRGVRPGGRFRGMYMSW